MSTMLAKEGLAKDGGGEYLVDSLAHSMATAAERIKVIEGRSHAAVASQRLKTTPTKRRKGVMPAIVSPSSEREARSLLRLAIADVERTNPGLRIAILHEDTLALAEEIRERLPEIREAQSQERIARLIGALVEFDDPLAEPRQKIDKANAALRVEFMRAFETFSSKEIADQANRPGSTNPHNLASRWKRGGKIFSIDWLGQQRFPAFQFDHGAPRPLIAMVLEIFDGALGPWETAFWFVSSNKWLDGRAPVNVFANAEGVIRAARSTTGEHFG